jgi:hypothetical protein
MEKRIKKETGVRKRSKRRIERQKGIRIKRSKREIGRRAR